MTVVLYIHGRKEDVVTTINEPTGSVHDEPGKLFSLSSLATSSDSLCKKLAYCNILRIFLEMPT